MANEQQMIGEVGETQILATPNFPQPLCHLCVLSAGLAFHV